MESILPCNLSNTGQFVDVKGKQRTNNEDKGFTDFVRTVKNGRRQYGVQNAYRKRKQKSRQYFIRGSFSVPVGGKNECKKKPLYCSGGKNDINYFEDE